MIRALHLGGEDANQLQIMTKASGIKRALHMGGEDANQLQNS
jgi:hypothetical protein